MYIKINIYYNIETFWKFLCFYWLKSSNDHKMQVFRPPLAVQMYEIWLFIMETYKQHINNLQSKFD